MLSLVVIPGPLSLPPAMFLCYCECNYRPLPLLLSANTRLMCGMKRKKSARERERERAKREAVWSNNRMADSVTTMEAISDEDLFFELYCEEVNDPPLPICSTCGDLQHIITGVPCCHVNTTLFNIRSELVSQHLDTPADETKNYIVASCSKRKNLQETNMNSPKPSNGKPEEEMSCLNPEENGDEKKIQSAVHCFEHTTPQNSEGLISSGQTENSITLQWNKVNNKIRFILQFNDTETNISVPDEDGPVTHTVSSLTPGTQYTFTLYSVFENVRSSGVSITAVTAPPNADSFRPVEHHENSITLQWNKVNNKIGFLLRCNDTETEISIPDEDGPVTHTVSSLTAGTEYTFTLYSVFENVRSSGVSITAVTAPQNSEGLISSGQTENSITLQWNKVNNKIRFILQFNDTETNISVPDEDGPVTHTVSSLTPGTQYTFTLYSVFENIRSSGVSITAVTAPQNSEGLISSGQTENSITLQWNKVNNKIRFILQFNDTETNISVPDEDGPVTHTVSSLTPGTQYTFTLYSVFENIRSSGVSITAVTVTAPPNADSFIPVEHHENSITLQWNKVSNNIGFLLQCNAPETDISVPDEDGPVTHTVSSLTAGTQYTFTLYSVFENIRSSGVSITAVTVPQNSEGLISSGQTDSSINLQWAPTQTGPQQSISHQTFIHAFDSETNFTAPPNADSFRPVEHHENSITLQWNKVNNNVSFVLRCNDTETDISVPDEDGPVTHTVSSLTAGTQYTFTLYSVFENIRSSGVSITAVTALPNADSFRPVEHHENSITLQWNKVNNKISFLLQFNDTETDINVPNEDGPVTHTVSSLTAGTQYTFTLYSVFENIRSSGVSITAVTAPQNSGGLISSGQTETSITLQWKKVNINISFVLQFNGTETNISVPDEDGPVTHTVSSLTAGTQYTFTLYSVFENVRSSGVSITAVTGQLIYFRKMHFCMKNIIPCSSLLIHQTRICLQVTIFFKSCPI
ncbi:tenascin-like isoform X10 [Oreochromis aureus]|uniref:tenascin-like isoform X10 n=1 Tax=Oreochromis aureus TaxID=47969 RepID=UPI001953E4B4|nr:tenascin-like isoform X10 [Oreochromis aureus]